MGNTIETSSPFARGVHELLGVSLSEAITASSLATETVGWLALAASGSVMSQIDTNYRINLVNAARIYALRDPLCVQIAELWTNFGIGRGLQWNAEDETVKAAIETFWDDPGNACMFSETAQRTLAHDLFVDGEIFVAVFGGQGQVPRVRLIDPIEIIDIATDPNDKYTELAYLRQYTLLNNTIKRVKYPSSITPASGVEIEFPTGQSGEEPEGDPVQVLHFRLRGTWGRGISGLCSTLDWAEAHRQFMKARIAIQQSLARYATKMKVDGTPAQLTTLAAADAARDAARAALDKQPPKGTTWYENKAADRQPMSQETGAEAAKVDGAMILQSVGAGVCIYPHYFGAGEAFRLATATAMELPMLRTFEAFQGLLYCVFDGIIKACLIVTGTVVDKGAYTITMPEIFSDNRMTLITAITQAVAAFPELAQSDDVKKLVLTLMNLKDPDEILDRIRQAMTQESAPVIAFLKQVQKLRESRHAD